MSRLSCILLAAGQSKRLPEANKLLLRLNGESLVHRTLRELSTFDFAELVVVTGHERDSVEQELSEFSVTTVFNENYSAGMHASIRKGVYSLTKACDAFVICLADQPEFSVGVVKKLKNAFDQNPTSLLFRPLYQGKPGHPVLIHESLRAEILRHEDGDFGCHYLFQKYGDRTQFIEVEENVLKDIDTREEFLAAGGFL